MKNLGELYELGEFDRLIIGNLIFKPSFFDDSIFYELQELNYDLFTQIEKLEESEVLVGSVDSNFSKLDKFKSLMGLPAAIDQLQYVNYFDRNAFNLRFEVMFLMPENVQASQQNVVN